MVNHDKIYFDGNINFKDEIPKEWYDRIRIFIIKHYMIEIFMIGD